MFSTGESFHESCDQEQVHSHFLQALAPGSDDEHGLDYTGSDDEHGLDYTGSGEHGLDYGLDITGSDGKVLFGESLPRDCKTGLATSSCSRGEGVHIVSIVPFPIPSHETRLL
jgi:hypothetical protein